MLTAASHLPQGSWELLEDRVDLFVSLCQWAWRTFSGNARRALQPEPTLPPCCAGPHSPPRAAQSHHAPRPLDLAVLHPPRD